MPEIRNAKSDATTVQAQLLVDRLTLGAITGDVPYSKLLYGADGGGGAVITLTSGLPVQPATGATWTVQGTVTANQGGAWNVGVSGTVTANAGTGTFTVGDGGGSLTVDSPQLPAALGQVTMAASLPVVLASNQSAVPVSGTLAVSSVGGTVTVGDGGGSLTVDSPQLPASLGGKTSAASLAVVLATDQAALPVQPAAAAVATTSNVAASVTSVQLLAANAARKGALVCNDSPALLWLKLGTTASATSFTVKLFPDAYYEVPAAYTGRIDGLWESAAGGGAARLTELT
jgi:hypothetical protein